MTEPNEIVAQAKQERRHFWQKITRDAVLFTVGLLLFIFEATVRRGGPRESILFMEAGMMGLGVINQAELWRKRNGNGSDGSSD